MKSSYSTPIKRLRAKSVQLYCGKIFLKFTGNNHKI